MNSEQKRIIIAVLLSGMVLFTWQTYFAPPVVVGENITETDGRAEAELGESVVSGKTKSVTNIIETIVDKNLSHYNLENEGHGLVVGNNLSITEAKNPNLLFDFKNIVGENKQPFQINILENGKAIPVSFTISQPMPNKLQGTNGKYGVAFKAELLENGKLAFNINSSKAYRYQFIIRSDKKELENRQIRSFAIYGKDVERVTVGDEEAEEGSIQWFGVDFNFHLMGFVFDKKILSRYKTTREGVFTLETVNPVSRVDVSYIFTLKNYDHLKQLGDKLDLSVDFGIFGIVAVPILRGLQFIYKYVPNYGFAIILLTLFIRFIMFPLQFKSSKSMKKMQKIQPQMKKLREKYKDNPQKMQQETMALMKSSGANPVGGCLPIIVQMPILFAFYQVLYNAVELVGAPFAGWVTDLSIKDPYYVLPVLMGIAMFFQTKVTPQATADPTQQKVMAFMPLIFCFFMKDLPAGLNLYIFVSTLFGIIQQLVVYKYTD